MILKHRSEAEALDCFCCAGKFDGNWEWIVQLLLKGHLITFFVKRTLLLYKSFIHLTYRITVFSYKTTGRI
jgi:hypothetical protein